MNTTEFLARVRTAAQLADEDEDFTDDVILQEATQALYERFAQPVAAMRHGYWLQRKTVSTVPNIAVLRLPPRSIVQGLEKLEVAWDTASSQWAQLSILTNSQATDYDQSGTNDRPIWFELEGDKVRLYPTPNTAWPIRMTYYLRPQVLATHQSTNAGLITAATTTQLTIAGVFAGQVGSAGLLDIIHTTGCNESVAVDVSYTGASTTIGVSLSAEQVSQIVLNSDVVRLADTTDYIPLPLEMHQSLVSFTAAVLLSDKGDQEKAGTLAGKTESAVKRLIDQAIPRIKSSSYKFKSRSTYLRRNAGWGGSGRGRR